MPGKDVGVEVRKKSIDLKNFFKDIKAVVEEWKFSVEETKAGTRVELRALALVRHPPHRAKKA